MPLCDNIFVDGCCVSLHLILFSPLVYCLQARRALHETGYWMYTMHAHGLEKTHDKREICATSISFKSASGQACRWPSSWSTRLTGNDYLQFLREELPVILEDVPLTVRQKMWFQHDGARSLQSSCQTVLDWELSATMDRAGRSCCMATMITRPKSLGLSPLGVIEVSGVWNGSRLHTWATAACAWCLPHSSHPARNIWASAPVSPATGRSMCADD
jgi:hypothetical protein